MSALLAGEPAADQAATIVTRSGPVVVLTYALAGTELLSRTLSASSSLGCTSGTGVLPLCHTAITTWEQVENRSGPPSALAIKSVRVLVDTMITVMLATKGARRWCETAFAPPSADAFFQVIPTAAFLCLHRGLAGVLKEAAQSYPWGLGGSPFWSYSAGHQGNNVATIGAYWAASARSLLDFEARHPGSCLRVRYEDLAADPYPHTHRIFTWLGLDVRDLALQPQPTGTAHEPDPTVPADRLPPQLLDQVNRLHGELGYQEMTTEPSES